MCMCGKEEGEGQRGEGTERRERRDGGGEEGQIGGMEGERRDGGGRGGTDRRDGGGEEGRRRERRDR